MSNDMEFGIAFLVVWLVFYLLVFGLGLANYIMTSWGLYSIADRRQISNPWLAWLPIGNFWIMGSIVDEYDGRNGIKRKWRMVLLILELIMIAVMIIFFVVIIASFFSFAFQFEYVEPGVGDVFGLIVPLYIFMIVLILLVSAFQILYMICLYKIFESTVPEKSVKYMILSIMIPLASAICLMVCRNKGYSNPKKVKVPVVVQNPDALEAPVEEAPKSEDIQTDVIDVPADEE